MKKEELFDTRDVLSKLHDDQIRKQEQSRIISLIEELKKELSSQKENGLMTVKNGELVPMIPMDCQFAIKILDLLLKKIKETDGFQNHATKSQIRGDNNG